MLWRVENPFALLNKRFQPLEKPSKNFLLFILIGLTSSITAQSSVLKEKVNLKSKRLNCLEIIHAIEKQVSVNFIYNPDELDTQRTFSFTKKRLVLKSVLDNLLADSPLTYQANGNQIILYKSQAEQMSYRINKAPPKQDKIIFSGYVLDAVTGEALIAASVYEKETFVATTTNQFGFFSLTLPNKSQTIVISFLGYDTQEIKLDNTQQTTVKLQPVANELAEVVVTADPNTDAENPVQSTQIGVMQISPTKLKSIPAFAGEADVLKAITLLPGVKQGVDGAAGFHVRGGSADQNLILLDGVPMYNPYHLFGFLSTFNPDAINHIEVTKGAFPARYGGRLSSVLDITTKDGNNQEWERKVSAGLLTAKVSVNGPLIKDRSSISVSARRTLLDLLIAPIGAERASDFKRVTTYNFGDANIKYNYKISNRDKLYVSGFYSRNGLKFWTQTEDEGLAIRKSLQGEGWQNAFGSLRWNHLFSDKLFSNTTAYLSHYKYFSAFSSSIESIDESLISSSLQENDYRSTILDMTIKQDYHYFINPKNTLRFGGGVIFHQLTPGVNTLFQRNGLETISGETLDNTTRSREYSLYVEDKLDLGRKLSVNLGVHASAFSVEDTTYTSIQPRVSARFLATKNVAIKAGYAQMTQFLHLLTSSNLNQSTDLWVPVTRKVAPALSTQFSFGTAIDLGEYGLEVEGYYKDMQQLIDYKEGAKFDTDNARWEEKIETGQGESYGAEILLQKKRGKLTGWLGYTLSWTNRQFENINFGETFSYKYDRRHDVSIVANYEFNPKWSFNGTWVFFSGSFATIPTVNHINPNFDPRASYAWFQFPNAQEGIFNISGRNPGINQNVARRNNYQLPDYHRLDLSASRTVMTKRNNKSVWTFGLTNAYNKFNPSFFSNQVEIESNPDSPNAVQASITATSIFTVLPTASYTLDF
ncbi:MAG: carboxypeptidase-like regulatory domain-containing protein [Saprospiraceae bacterium]